MKLEIDSWEDRSGLPEPGPQSFGYVYFKDGSRVGYSSALIEGHDLVWQPRTNGGGKYQEVTPAHLRMTRELLVELGIWNPATVS